MYNQHIQGTIFRRENGVWYANYISNNKRVKESLKTKNKKEAQAKLQHRLANPNSKSILFGEILEETLEDMRLRGLKSYDVVLYHAKPVKSALSKFKIGDIDENVIRNFIHAQLSSELRPSTVNRRLHLISQTLKTARAKGIISHMPHIQRLSEAGNARQGFFTQSEIERLLPHLPGYLQDFTLFAWLVGWRKSEISGLLWSENMDWESKVIRISQSKNGDGRILPLIGELYGLVLRRWEVNNGDYIFHRNGRPLGDFRRAWNTGCTKAGLSGRLFHDCRRSAVRNAIESGLSERHTMALCGHRTNHMLHRYHIVVEYDLRQAMLKTVANASTRLKNVSDTDADEKQSPQPFDFSQRRRIGAGVPPGLQIQ